MPAPPALIDQASQRPKQFRHPVDFVQHYQPVLILSKKQGWIIHLPPVFCRLQIQIKGWHTL